MELGQLKEYFEQLPQGTTFNFTLSDPFSWRGSYDEVAFAIDQQASTREQALEKIEKALTDTFFGYKGGEFEYYEYTKVHFEEHTSRYTDGEYVNKWIEKIQGVEIPRDLEKKLVELAFPK